jgi:AcrR family transcriptional regulator
MTRAASYGQRSRLAEPRSQRRRLIASMTVLSADCGRRGLSVEKACDHAGVSKTKFYELFDDLDDCIAAAVEDAHEALWTVVERAIESLPPGEWARTVSAAIVGFLAALEANPTAAWLCVVEPLNGVPRAREARRQLIERLASLIPADVDRAPTPTAPGSIGALWESPASTGRGRGRRAGSPTYRARRSSSSSPRTSAAARQRNTRPPRPRCRRRCPSATRPIRWCAA